MRHGTKFFISLNKALTALIFVCVACASPRPQITQISSSIVRDTLHTTILDTTIHSSFDTTYYHLRYFIDTLRKSVVVQGSTVHHAADTTMAMKMATAAQTAMRAATKADNNIKLQKDTRYPYKLIWFLGLFILLIVLVIIVLHRKRRT